MNLITQEIMHQAQVFASSWALVGSSFASENQFKESQQEKLCLWKKVDIIVQQREELLSSLKKLSFAAQTSGGVAGGDDELIAAIQLAGVAIAKAEFK